MGNAIVPRLFGPRISYRYLRQGFMTPEHTKYGCALRDFPAPCPSGFSPALSAGEITVAPTHCATQDSKRSKSDAGKRSITPRTSTRGRIALQCGPIWTAVLCRPMESKNGMDFHLRGFI